MNQRLEVIEKRLKQLMSNVLKAGIKENRWRHFNTMMDVEGETFKC